MEIRNNAEALKAFLGITSTASEKAGRNADAGSAQVALERDRATLSAAGSEVSQAAADAGVRTDKVAAIQQALAAGTYKVPATAVADKLIDNMLGK